MPRYCPRCGETLHTHSTTKGEVRKTARRAYEPKTKKPRKVSAYQKAYGHEFRKVLSKYQKANGGWKKDGFKRAQAAAHKATRKRKKEGTL